MTNQMDLLAEARRAQEALTYAGRARHIMNEMVSERDILAKRVAVLDEAIGQLRTSLDGLGAGSMPRAERAKVRGTRRIVQGSAHGAIRERVLAVCAKAPSRLPEIVKQFPDVKRNTVAPIVTALVQEGKLVRSGALSKYVYATPAGTALAVPRRARDGRPVAGSVRQRVLDLCLTGEPKTAKDLYPHLPGANRHTIQSGLNSLVSRGLLALVAGRPGRYAYGPPGTAKKAVAVPTMEAAKAAQKAADAPRDGTHASQVLAVCSKTPLSFDGISQLVPHINRHVLHQTVHSLYATRKLKRAGKRNSYVYVTA